VNPDASLFVGDEGVDSRGVTAFAHVLVAIENEIDVVGRAVLQHTASVDQRRGVQEQRGVLRALLQRGDRQQVVVDESDARSYVDSMTDFAGSPLGRSTPYPDRYAPSLLFAVPRAPQRALVGLTDKLPFSGCDVWNAYELTWLDLRGRPRIAMAVLRVPAESPAMVESKSLKLYLGSFAQEPLASEEEFRQRVTGDLAGVCGGPVAVHLSVGADVGAALSTPPRPMQGESIDESDFATDGLGPDPSVLTSVKPGAQGLVDESLRSSLFRSLCPVTGQPDYADIFVRYRGPRIERAGLLRYLVSYRLHAAFHEACVERIFVDILDRCAPDALSVYARFMRRGGIDINPFRSNFETAPPENIRTPRQ
jgi:7-cyano-7-deazaguanine reductase